MMSSEDQALVILIVVIQDLQMRTLLPISNLQLLKRLGVIVILKEKLQRLQNLILLRLREIRGSLEETISS